MFLKTTLASNLIGRVMVGLYIYMSNIMFTVFQTSQGSRKCHIYRSKVLDMSKIWLRAPHKNRVVDVRSPLER